MQLQSSFKVEIYGPANGSVKVFVFIFLGSYSPINCHWRLNLFRVKRKKEEPRKSHWDEMTAADDLEYIIAVVLFE